jgi:hypothetical protein
MGESHVRYPREDILTVPTEKIIDAPIDMTLIDGKVVYDGTKP